MSKTTNPTLAAVPTTEAKASIVPIIEVPKTVDALLSTILLWPRPDSSAAEFAFRGWLDSTLMTMKVDVRTLNRGCRYVEIPLPSGQPSTTLFSCHIDTVDTNTGLTNPEGGIAQKHVVYDDNFGIITLAKDNKVGSCLGADDGVGVWLMLNMIQRKVPGGYIFHTGEEVGGLGSRSVLAGNADILKKYELALAFDRPRTDEVITHQGGLRCASDKCADALCERLNKHGFSYKKSDRGSFTDTKIYRGIIAECFNLGVGYQFQHGAQEELDYVHATELLEAVCKIDFESLPIDRDPAKADPAPTYPTYPKYTPHNYAGLGSVGTKNYGNASLLDDDEEDVVWPARSSTPAPAVSVPAPDLFTEFTTGPYDTTLAYVQDNPDAATQDIIELCMEIAKLRAENRTLRAVYVPEV